mmetsp:Transcript_11101/g.30769  ORF Transcript_11101/g.30769 Transcript_11101/m.30769 type:complete len:502 (+) Transcript_11101:414-1919(+)|eukprot:scaffold324665_cov58-Tisochrysis_lutea.AAC.3
METTSSADGAPATTELSAEQARPKRRLAMLGSILNPLSPVSPRRRCDIELYEQARSAIETVALITENPGVWERLWWSAGGESRCATLRLAHGERWDVLLHIFGPVNRLSASARSSVVEQPIVRGADVLRPLVDDPLGKVPLYRDPVITSRHAEGVLSVLKPLAGLVDVTRRRPTGEWFGSPRTLDARRGGSSLQLGGTTRTYKATTPTAALLEVVMRDSSQSYRVDSNLPAIDPVLLDCFFEDARAPIFKPAAPRPVAGTTAAQSRDPAPRTTNSAAATMADKPVPTQPPVQWESAPGQRTAAAPAASRPATAVAPVATPVAAPPTSLWDAFMPKPFQAVTPPPAAPDSIKQKSPVERKATKSEPSTKAKAAKLATAKKPPAHAAPVEPEPSKPLDVQPMQQSTTEIRVREVAQFQPSSPTQEMGSASPNAPSVEKIGFPPESKAGQWSAGTPPSKGLEVSARVELPPPAPVVDMRLLDQVEEGLKRARKRLDLMRSILDS